jgi:tetratricopeptide (TPR) repeat protein
MLRLRTLGLAIAFAFVVGALPTFAQTGGLSGKATLQDGTPCVKCILAIERQEVKGNYTCKTDKKGNYVYIGLPLGTYKITLEDPNGKALYSFNGKHVGLGDPTPVDFDLKKEQAIQQQEHPELAKQAEEQLKQQKQAAGLKQFFDQGNAAMADKKYPEAVAAFEQALPLTEGNAKNQEIVLGVLAGAYHKAGQNDKAVDAYQKALAADPTNADMHNNLGSVYADMRKTPEAQAEFQKAAEIDPTHASRYYFNLGAVMTNSSKLDEAAAAFKKATEVDPKFADAYFLEAQSLMAKATIDKDGKVIPAPGTVEALQTYLQLDPNGKYAPSAQSMLQTLTGQVQTEFKKEKPKKK